MQIVDKRHGRRSRAANASSRLTPSNSRNGGSRVVAERLAEFGTWRRRSDEPQAGELARDLAPQDERLAVRDEVGQRGDERLVPAGAPRGPSAVQHRRAVGAPRELGAPAASCRSRARRPAAELALAADRDAEARVQPVEQLGAAHERPAAGLDAEPGRERRRGRASRGDASPAATLRSVSSAARSPHGRERRAAELAGRRERSAGSLAIARRTTSPRNSEASGSTLSTDGGGESMCASIVAAAVSRGYGTLPVIAWYSTPPSA